MDVPTVTCKDWQGSPPRVTIRTVRTKEAMEPREAERENLARSAESLASAARDLHKIAELVEAQREAEELLMAAMQQHLEDQAAIVRRAVEIQGPGTQEFLGSEELTEEDVAAFAVAIVREVREEPEPGQLMEAPSPDEVRWRVEERREREAFAEEN